MDSSHSWTKAQIQNHVKAGEKLALIKDEVALFIAQNSKNLYEKDVIKYIKSAYKKHGLINDHKKEFCIVAFGKNTKEVHYFPKGRGAKLKPNTLILLDIWVRLDTKQAPYADATFMLHHGNKVSKEIEKVWNILTTSRDSVINYIKKEIKKGYTPKGLEIDRTAHDIIGKAGLGHGIKHTIGHSLGFDSPHGKLPGINWREYSPILKNVGYTIEPGIYLNSFGMRTEIDFYISGENKVIITIPVQRDITII